MKGLIDKRLRPGASVGHLLPGIGDSLANYPLAKVVVEELDEEADPEVGRKCSRQFGLNTFELRLEIAESSVRLLL